MAATEDDDYDEDDGVEDCINCGHGIAEIGDECWECHDSWRYISVPLRLT